MAENDMRESPDERGAVYQDLHRGQLSQQEGANHVSAEFILTQLFRYYVPKSVLDVGCGIGTWLAVARSKGVADILGIEGKWLDPKLARIAEDLIVDLDLEQPFDLGRRFDLAISLEVAEHLSARAASGFVESLARHADVVLFSAAIPFQGGHHHVNEQFLDYWGQLFEARGYRPVDCLRALLWTNPAILWWLRQNTVVFAKTELTTGQGPFAGRAEGSGPLSIVHPDVYLDRMKNSQRINEEHAQLIALLSSGTTFSVQRHANGQLTINKLT
jgi:SAM-dependent methyltransferase